MAMQISGGATIGSGGSPNPSPSPSYSFQGSTSDYAMGGGTDHQSNDQQTNVIQKFSFTSDGNATDVGDLAVGVYGAVGVQV